jgi:Domain of unknown function (DUF4157)
MMDATSLGRSTMVHAHQIEKDNKGVPPRQRLVEKNDAGPALGMDSLQRVQRSLGNCLLQRLAASLEPVQECAGGAGCSCAHCAGRHVQAKLTVGAVDDAYEREADSVADQVMRMADKPAGIASRETAPALNIQRVANDAGSMFETDIQLNHGGGQPLSPLTRAFMEPRFRADFSHVQLHSDDQAQKSASEIQARAFTYGNHIWLGKGESEQDRRLMAHELTHVVQQGKASVAGATEGPATSACDDARVQRDPNQQCPNGRKTITVDMVSLRGSSRPAPDDLDFANSVFRPCCVNLQMGVGVTPTAALSDTWLGGDTIMNRATAAGAIDPEQTAAYDGATAAFHLGGRIHAFYVDDTNPVVGLATSFPAVWATGLAAPYTGMVIVTNRAARRSLAHEIGHILLNVTGAVHTSHPGATDNLMEPTATATGETLEPTQCATIFANS